MSDTTTILRFDPITFFSQGGSTYGNMECCEDGDFVSYEDFAALKNAQILSNEIPVRHSVRPDVGREFLTIDCPEGWDDVKKVCHKVLAYDGRKFTFTGWNSDRNEAFFARSLSNDPATATILNK